MKVLSVVGARPQFVKAAVVSRAIAALAREGAPIAETIVHTGQHYDANMSEVFFEQMRIPRPQYNLEVRQRTHGAMTGRMLRRLEEVMVTETPDVVLVYGDTNSTLAGALAAAKLNLPVAHVEAGLRSFRRDMPEEINRIVTDQISRWLFCPTAAAVGNLTAEGFPTPEGEGGARTYRGSRVRLVGDVMLDAVRYYRKIATPSPRVAALLRSTRGRFALSTVHRAENTDDPTRLEAIVAGLEEIAREIPVVLPVHPRTRKAIVLRGLATGAVRVMDPVGYFDMLVLLERCSAVLTDSGGLQKEAFFFGKPCITLRGETEWTELVAAGVNRLAGADRRRIVGEFRAMTASELPAAPALYGSGDAGERVVAALTTR
jgi:UDP-GlcNAc3NAcA epimerase